VKAIITGAGAVGFHIAKHMALENEDAVVIDTDSDALRRVSNNIDIETILSSGSSPVILEAAGLNNAEIILAVELRKLMNIKGVVATMRTIIIATLLFLTLVNGVASAAKELDIIEIEAEGSYRIGADASVDLARKVALFTAKRHAVDLVGRYFSHKSFIKAYEMNKDEIYSLAAREIQVEILEEKTETFAKTSTYRLRIRAKIKTSDFVKAEIEDAKQEKKEAKESYQEKMEQPVSEDIDPGKDIAKAYRLLREKKWRVAIIYLNNLEKKYPNWDSIYMAKAITYYILREPVFMKKALKKACRLDNQIACDDLKSLKRVHQHDFGISIIE
jgi:hypothetical protein